VEQRPQFDLEEIMGSLPQIYRLLIGGLEGNPGVTAGVKDPNW